MLILGIETATAQVGCAIAGHEGVIASFQAAKGRRHAETLVPAIEFMCRQVHIELPEIGALAVDIGPGLYTGLRVGIATGKAMAQALRVPMIGVSSLDLLAFPLRYSNRLIAAAIDARRGELFYAFYRQVPGGLQRLSSYQLGTPADLASELMATGQEAVLVGDGTRRYLSDFENVARTELADMGNAYPSPAALVELAHSQALREEFVLPSELAPLYLRRSDAEIAWEHGPTGENGRKAWST